MSNQDVERKRETARAWYHRNKEKVAAYKKHLLANDWEEMPQYFVTSSEDGTGRDDILKYIDAVNDEINSGSQF